MGIRVGAFNELYRDLREASPTIAASPDVSAENRQLQQDFAQSRSRLSFHMLLGLLASLAVVLVNSIAVTYFIGTSRWCREVVETYSLPLDLARQSAELKRRSFPWALAGIVIVLSIVMLGGASDPSTGLQNTTNWVVPHFLAGCAGACLIALSFVMQVGYIRRNSDVVDEILAQVRSIRIQKGLQVD